MMRKRFWLRVSMEPTRSPMGVMLISAPRVKNMMPTMIMAAPSRKQSRMLGETGAMLKQSTSMMAAMGRTACSASSSFSRSLGMDDLIMMSTSLSRPEAVPPGVGIEKYFLIKYTKTDKSPSTKERLRLAKKQKCYKKKRLPRFCTAALKIRIQMPCFARTSEGGVENTGIPAYGSGVLSAGRAFM